MWSDLFEVDVCRKREEVEEVDNKEPKKNQQQPDSISNRRPVDRPVDRRAPTCTGHLRSTARSTAEGAGRPPVDHQSTD